MNAFERHPFLTDLLGSSTVRTVMNKAQCESWTCSNRSR